jgi:hypothetical protein
MTKKRMLIGSLSNDLVRVANLTHRGSTKAAQRFLEEAKRWATELQKYDLKEYIANIVDEVLSETKLTIESAEKLLMYSTLLQNYTLKIE